MCFLQVRLPSHQPLPVPAGRADLPRNVPLGGEKASWEALGLKHLVPPDAQPRSWGTGRDVHLPCVTGCPPPLLTSSPRVSSVAALSSIPYMPQGHSFLGGLFAWLIPQPGMFFPSIPCLPERWAPHPSRCQLKCHLLREVLGASSPQETCPVPPPRPIPPRTLSVRLKWFPSQYISQFLTVSAFGLLVICCQPQEGRGVVSDLFLLYPQQPAYG